MDLFSGEKEHHPDFFLDSEFFDFLKMQLSLALGPIAGYLIEDEIRGFGGDVAKVPRHRAAELVDRLSRQIQRQENKITFQQALLKKIKEITT